MRYHLILPFIGFLFRKAFSSAFRLNRAYRREMERHPGLAIFLGAICSLLFVAITTVVSAIFIGDTLGVRYVFVGAAFTAISYIVFTFFSILFNDFLEERQELFDVIKDDRSR